MSGALVRLPLWKSTLEDLIHEGIEYGKVIDAKWFEDRLRASRATIRFAMGITRIRQELEHHGRYLKGSTDTYVIIPAHENVVQAKSNWSHVVKTTKRTLTLLTQTDRRELNAEQKKRHEGAQEKMGLRLALMSRSQSQLKRLTKK